MQEQRRQRVADLLSAQVLQVVNIKINFINIFFYLLLDSNYDVIFELPDTYLHNRILILSQFDNVEKSASSTVEAETRKVWPPAAPDNNWTQFFGRFKGEGLGYMSFKGSHTLRTT